MRCRGAIAFLIIFALVFGGASAYAFPVSHENFSEADEDLFAILSFLTDSKNLCEQSLLSSYAANCTLQFNENIVISFDNRQLNASLEKSEELQQKLGYSSDVLGKLENKAGSYEHLKGFLLPIKDLGDNVTSVVTTHETLIHSFQTLADAANSGGAGNVTILSKLAEAHNILAGCRKGINSVGILLEDISPFFSTEILENILVEFNELLDGYESYLNMFVDFFPSTEPQLILIAEETDVYLGESIPVSGFFIAESGFVSNHEIYLMFDNLTVNSTTTNHIGRYEEILLTSTTDDPTTHTVTAFTFFNETKYTSNSITVTLHKIPTKLVLTLPKNQFQPQESIVFSGQLRTYTNQGIQGSVLLSYDGDNQSVLTNATGNFTYTVSNGLPYGKYSAFATYAPQSIYEPCISNTIQFYVNTPTKLSINTETKNLTVGDALTVNGQLRDALTSQPINKKSIQLFFNNHVVETAITNETGEYMFSWKIDNVDSGATQIYTRYASDDLQWRSCTSQTIDVYVSAGLLGQIEGFISDFNNQLFVLPLFFILLILIGLFLIILIYIKRKSSAIKTGQKNFFHQSSSLPFLSKYRGKKPYISKSSLSQNAAYADPSVSLKQRIITQYRLLLRYLSSRGLRFPPSSTHLDIQKKLKTAGSAKNSVDSVTNTFEHARYSPHPTKKNDADMFDKNVFKIITDFRK